jgi:hypothetical protein
LIFPLPAPGSVPKKAPVPWDAAAPFKGLGYRSVQLDGRQDTPVLAELQVQGRRGAK